MIQRKFSPKFNPTNIIYNGVTDIWLGDGQTETRPDFNDVGKLYVKYGESADPICLGPVSSYAVAKDAGYTGTPEEWQAIISGANNAQSYAEDAGESADLAEAWATGSTDSSHPAHNNSAKDWAETAQTKATEAETARTGANTERNAAAQEASNAAESASAAETHALTSEAYAVGTKNGTEITDPNDPAYENNAKYYSDQLSFAASLWNHSSFVQKEATWFPAADTYMDTHRVYCWRLGPFLILYIHLTMSDKILSPKANLGTLPDNYKPRTTFYEKCIIDSGNNAFGDDDSGFLSFGIDSDGNMSFQNMFGSTGAVRHVMVVPVCDWVEPQPQS